MLKHYVTFLYPGIFLSEESSKEVKSRDEKFEVPKTCFAYYFWDREEQEIRGEILKGEAKNKSGLFYFGELMTVKDVEEKLPKERVLLSNMRSNNWDKIVRTRRGNFQPFNKGDKILQP